MVAVDDVVVIVSIYCITIPPPPPMIKVDCSDYDDGGGDWE